MFNSELKVSAPGRLCLLGEHQDYFGLPIIAAAIDLRVTIQGKSRPDRIFSLDLPDIGEKDEFALEKEIKYLQERDYLRSVINVLRRKKVLISRGWDCRIQGTIPINSGTSSSSAMVIAWIKFLLEAAKDKKAKCPEDIAELGFLSEVAEFKEPGGKMDHYASSLGGVVNVYSGENFSVRQFDQPLKEFVLADSLIRKNTTGTLSHIKNNVLAGINKVKRRLKDFNLSSPMGFEEKHEIEKLPEVEKRLLKGTLKTRDITAEGEKLFMSNSFDHHHFGDLLSRQQEVMRDYLKISTPKLNKMIETTLENGALGAKINGSGLGGCIFAYAPSKADLIAEELRKLDTKVYIVRVDEGARVEN
ncbi:MAG: hypothetical protein JW755_12160 [Candidatus Aminicenantes bacterium]|nr:hypothetical protein [Candidatus Aminicenantes bacterium]